MLGTFAVRELFSHHPLIKKLFGGLNIFLFWAISFYIFHKFDAWLFGKSLLNSKTTTPVITKKAIVLAIIIVLLFFTSFRVFQGLNVFLFWLIIIIISWLLGLLIDYQRRRTKGERDR